MPNRNVRIRPLAASTVQRTPINDPKADISSIALPLSALLNLMAVTTTVTTAIPIRMNRLNHLLNFLSSNFAIVFVIPGLTRNLYSFK